MPTLYRLLFRASLNGEVLYEPQAPKNMARTLLQAHDYNEEAFLTAAIVESDLWSFVARELQQMVFVLDAGHQRRLSAMMYDLTAPTLDTEEDPTKQKEFLRPWLRHEVLVDVQRLRYTNTHEKLNEFGRRTWRRLSRNAVLVQRVVDEPVHRKRVQVVVCSFAKRDHSLSTAYQGTHSEWFHCAEVGSRETFRRHSTLPVSVYGSGSIKPFLKSSRNSRGPPRGDQRSANATFSRPSKLLAVVCTVDDNQSQRQSGRGGKRCHQRSSSLNRPLSCSSLLN